MPPLAPVLAVVGLNNMAARVTEGATSCISSSHLLPMLGSKLVKPVIIPPGREKLCTKPALIGSETDVNTIGMPIAASRTASVAGVASVTTSSAPRLAPRLTSLRHASACHRDQQPHDDRSKGSFLLSIPERGASFA